MKEENLTKEISVKKTKKSPAEKENQSKWKPPGECICESYETPHVLDEQSDTGRQNNQ